MNTKGQTMPLAILNSLAIFVIGFLLINFLLPEVTTFRNSLSCASPALINDGTKILCLIGDGIIPYVILGIISLAVGLITARMKL